MAATIPTTAGRMDTVGLGTTICAVAIAAVWGLIVLVTGAFRLVHVLASETVTLSQPVSVDIPADTGGSAQLVEGTFRIADITVAGVPGVVRALLATSTALDILAHLSVVIGVIMLCISLMRERPFMPAMVRALIITSFALVVCGMLSTGLLAFANMEVAYALDAPGFPMLGNLDFTAAFVGLALALVATAFAIGQRMQRDTEGLI